MLLRLRLPAIISSIRFYSKHYKMRKNEPKAREGLQIIELLFCM